MMVLGKHEQGVSRVRYDPATRLLFSGSWDKTLQVWDPHASECAPTQVALPGKVFAMDLARQGATSCLVVAMSERAVYMYDTASVRRAIDNRETPTPAQKRESSLKFMLRDVRCMPDGAGYVTSSVEGRVAVEFLDPAPGVQANKYAFKCHRKEVDGVDVVYPIHGLAFHPRYGTFATCGGDAHCALWDPVAKKRIRQYTLPAPVSGAAFSSDGTMMVIASGADNLEDGAPAAPAAVALHVKYVATEAKPKVKGDA